MIKEYNNSIINNNIFYHIQYLTMKINLNWIKNIIKKQAEDISWDIKKNKIIAQDVMTEIQTINEKDDINSIIKKLQREDINYCAVIDDNENFLWEISDEILIHIIAKWALQEPLVKILDIWYKRSINYTKAKDYIQKKKNIISPKTTLFEIMQMIYKKWFQYLPVIEKQKVIGMVTSSSIMKYLLKK